MKTYCFLSLIVSDSLSWPVLLWHLVVKYCNYSLSHLHLKWFIISSMFYFPVFSLCPRLEIEQELVLHSLPKQTQVMRVLVPKRPAPPLVVAFSNCVEESRQPAFQTLVSTSFLFSYLVSCPLSMSSNHLLWIFVSCVSVNSLTRVVSAVVLHFQLRKGGSVVAVMLLCLKLRHDGLSCDAMFPAETGRKGTEHLDLAGDSPRKNQDGAPLPPSPETKKKSRGFKKFFGR